MQTLRGLLSAIAVVVGAEAAQAQEHRPYVAVAKIEDPAGSGQSATLSQMILTAVAATQKFAVIESGQVDTLVQQQAKSRAGLYTSRNGGKMGGFQNPDYLIYGTITALSVTKKSDIGTTFGLAMLTGNHGATNCYSGQVTLSIDIRITDGTSGQIRYVKRIDEAQKAGSLCGEGVPQVNAAQLLRGAADHIAAGLVTTVYPMKVADVGSDGSLMLNYGEGAVKVGDYLTVFKPGHPVVDPDTGKPMGTSEERVGIVQVTDVESSFSKARAIAGFTTPAEVRDIARATTDDDRRALPTGNKRHRGDN